MHFLVLSNFDQQTCFQTSIIKRKGHINVCRLFMECCCFFAYFLEVNMLCLSCQLTLNVNSHIQVSLLSVIMPFYARIY